MRTLKQNKALYLYFTHLAELLNDAGLDMRKVLKPAIDIPWTYITIKEYLWKPVQETMLKKKSTTELTTKDIDKIYNTINRHLSEKFGVTEAWPSIEELYKIQHGQKTKKTKT